MSKQSFFFFLFFLPLAKVFAGAAVIEPPPGDPSRIDYQATSIPVFERGEYKGILETIDGIADMIAPESLNCAKEELMAARFTTVKSIDNKEVWLANSGVVSDFYLKATHNLCFGVLVEDYYKNILEMEPEKVPLEEPDRLSVEGRPALNASLGAGSFNSHPKGYLWEAAMKASAGNAELAMELVGYCGHDDQEQNYGGLIMSTKDKDAVRTSLSFITDRARREAIENVPESSFDEVQKLVIAGNEAFMKEMEQEIENGKNLATDVRCPKKNAHFYGPGALDESLILPPDLIKKIADLQAPTKGAGVLPAKAYHGNFAAMLACRLKSKCALSQKSTEWLLGKVADVYRSTRLNAMKNKYLKIRDVIEERFDVNWIDGKALADLTPDIKKWLESSSAKPFFLARGLEELFSNGKQNLDWDLTKEYIDASILNNGGERGRDFLAIPMSAGRDPFYDPDYYKIHGRPQTSYCPGWSEERCNKARLRNDTWMVDFEWTRKQQELGVAFAYSQCSDKPLEVGKASCEALEKRIVLPDAPRAQCLSLQHN